MFDGPSFDHLLLVRSAVVLGNSMYRRKPPQMSIFCFGLSHETAAVDVRERFAIPESALPEALARLKTMPGVNEGLIISTCNRTEFYLTGEFRDTSASGFFKSFYRDLRAGDETHLFRLWADHRVRHLYRVASGLESIVVVRNGNFWPSQTSLRVCDLRKDDWQVSESTVSKIVSSR